MSSLKHIKHIQNITPSLLELLKSAMFGGEIPNEFSSYVDYVAGDIVYRVTDDGDIIIYSANIDIPAGSEFNEDEWEVINVVGGIGGTVISDLEPENRSVDTWIKPITYTSYDISSITMQISHTFFDVEYIRNVSTEQDGEYVLVEEKYSYDELPVGSTPENTIASVVNIVGEPELGGGVRIIPPCSNGYPILRLTGGFSGNTNITGFDTGSLEYIGDSVFSDCINLNQLVIQSPLITISPGAFSNTGLTTLDLPDTVESVIGAFTNCTSLTTVTVRNRDTVLTDAFIGSAVEIIYGLSGSTAQEYAIANGINFITMEI